MEQRTRGRYELTERRRPGEAEDDAFAQIERGEYQRRVRLDPTQFAALVKGEAFTLGRALVAGCIYEMGSHIHLRFEWGFAAAFLPWIVEGCAVCDRPDCYDEPCRHPGRTLWPNSPACGRSAKSILRPFDTVAAEQFRTTEFHGPARYVSDTPKTTTEMRQAVCSACLVVAARAGYDPLCPLSRLARHCRACDTGWERHQAPIVKLERDAVNEIERLLGPMHGKLADELAGQPVLKKPPEWCEELSTPARSVKSLARGPA